MSMYCASLDLLPSTLPRRWLRAAHMSCQVMHEARFKCWGAGDDVSVTVLEVLCTFGSWISQLFCRERCAPFDFRFRLLWAHANQSAHMWHNGTMYTCEELYMKSSIYHFACYLACALITAMWRLCDYFKIELKQDNSWFGFWTVYAGVRTDIAFFGKDMRSISQEADV